MTDSDYTHITILADRTGSMGEATDPGRTKAMDTTDGIRKMVTDQAALPGKTTFSLVQFNSAKVDRVAWLALGSDEALTGWQCVPYGGTPLLDAVGGTIHETGEALSALPEDERPGKVIFVIATDGEENSSREYKLPQVKEMVTRQREAYGWEFAFIGVDVDAFADAGSMGIPQAATLDSAAVAMAASYNATSDAITRTRATGESLSYSTAERSASSGA